MAPTDIVSKNSTPSRLQAVQIFSGDMFVTERSAIEVWEREKETGHFPKEMTL